MSVFRQALAVFAASFRILWDELFTFVACNVIWLLLCIPVVTAPASFAALYYVADLAARDKTVKIGDFFDGFKQYLVKGSALILIDLVLGILIGINILFYLGIDATWARVVQAVWMAMGLFWVIIQVYLLPMLVVQIEPKIWWSFRNAVMLTAAQPIFSFTIAFGVLAVLVASIALVMPIMIIGMSVAALLSCVALNNRLDHLRIRQQGGDGEDVDR